MDEESEKQVSSLVTKYFTEDERVN
jgi:hypothetical protein